MEEKERYLYGAAVQGIQGFIFQTNALKDIVGASELVEAICTTFFARQLGMRGTHDELMRQLDEDSNAIVNAAGNIKYIFESREQCERLVKVFPKRVMEYAPGITVSQAVVKLADGDFSTCVQKLETALRAQRNKPMRDTGLGLMGIERSRQTGLPVTQVLKNGLHLDAGAYLKLYSSSEKHGKVERKNTTQQLCRKSFGEKYDDERVAFDIKEITGKNDWVAIIHADGNGLGQVVQTIGTDKGKFKKFSRLLDLATRQAAVMAFKEVMEVYDDKNDATGVFPLRPVVLSGDDHTVICRAELAVPYTRAFIVHFEEQTGKLLGGMLENVFRCGSGKLTACAGIAFIKSSYPFYYGYRLAESLCDRAKRDTKRVYGFEKGNLPASCLMFHKVQDSFVTDYEDIARRELMPAPGHSFEFGPYYLFTEGADETKIREERKWTVGQLCEKCEELQKEGMGAIHSGLRNWLSLMCIDPEMALQRKERMVSISGEAGKKYVEEVCGKSPYPVYDILAINTINTQQTNRKEE